MNLQKAIDLELEQIHSAANNCESFTTQIEDRELSFPEYSAAAINDAGNKAQQAQLEWAGQRFSDRAKLFRHVKNVLHHHLDEFVAELRKDTQKPFQEILIHEITPVLDGLKYYPKLAPKILRPQKRRSHLFLTKTVILRHLPFGTIGIISPWNFPFFLTMNPIIQALAAGNAIIHKPSEFTTWTGVIVQALLRMADCPKHLVQMVSGQGPTGAALVESPHIDKVVFTGSTATGKKVMKSAAERLIPVSLELGGKDPMIVLPDANLETASKAAVFGAFANSGQVCASTERAFVHESIFDRFEKNVLEQTKALTENKESGYKQGPIISSAQVNILRAQLEDAKKRGATILTGGKIEKNYMEPTIITQTNAEMLVTQEESFGPILPLIRYSNIHEVVQSINRSSYGLNASIFSKNRKEAIRIAKQIESGHIMINDVLTSPGLAEAPWGGMKNSGIGRINGEEGLKSFCETQSVIDDNFLGMGHMVWFPYSPAKYQRLKNLLKLYLR